MWIEWLGVTALTSSEAIVEGLRLTVQRLPGPNYDLLYDFMEFLVELASHEEKNRMGAKNISLVFGASLLDPPSDTNIDARMHAFNIKLQSLVVENMITHFSTIFPEKPLAKSLGSKSTSETSLTTSGTQIAGTRRRMMMLGLDTDSDSAASEHTSDSSPLVRTPSGSIKTHFADVEPDAESLKRESSTGPSPRLKGCSSFARLADVHSGAINTASEMSPKNSPKRSHRSSGISPRRPGSVSPKSPSTSSDTIDISQ